MRCSRQSSGTRCIARWSQYANSSVRNHASTMFAVEVVTGGENRSTPASAVLTASMPPASTIARHRVGARSRGTNRSSTMNAGATHATNVRLRASSDISAAAAALDAVVGDGDHRDGGRDAEEQKEEELGGPRRGDAFVHGATTR